MPETMQRRAERGAHARARRDNGLLAATLSSDLVDGQPARFTFDLGDATVCRGPWDCRPAVTGDKVAVMALDDGTLWVVGAWNV
jgi:hypothetical protein